MIPKDLEKILNENYPLKEFEKEEKVKISYREKEIYNRKINHFIEKFTKENQI